MFFKPSYRDHLLIQKVQYKFTRAYKSVFVVSRFTLIILQIVHSRSGKNTRGSCSLSLPLCAVLSFTKLLLIHGDPVTNYKLKKASSLFCIPNQQFQSPTRPKLKSRCSIVYACDWLHTHTQRKKFIIFCHGRSEDGVSFPYTIRRN